MTGQIVTVRHGRPDMDRTVRITAEEYGVWWANYDLAGLAPGQEPSQALCDLSKECDVVISSTLPRAIETAAKITGGSREVPKDAMYVEAPLPAPPVPFLKCTPTTWGRISRVYWFLGYAPGDMENHLSARRRVRDVAQRLIAYASEGHNVMLAAHGYLNWMIDGELRKHGWKKFRHEGENDFWSFRAYRLNAPATSAQKEAKPLS